MLAGLLYPTSGSARVLGYVPWERDDGYRRQFALLLGQKNQLWWDLPARESLELERQDLRHSRRRARAHGRRNERAARRPRQARRQRPRAFPGRTHEDGADRLAAAPAESAVPRRADHRPGRGFAESRARIPRASTTRRRRPPSCSPATTWPTSRSSASASSSSTTARSSSTAASSEVVDRFADSKLITIQCDGAARLLRRAVWRNTAKSWSRRPGSIQAQGQARPRDPRLQSPAGRTPRAATSTSRKSPSKKSSAASSRASEPGVMRFGLGARSNRYPRRKLQWSSNFRRLPLAGNLWLR